MSKNKNESSNNNGEVVAEEKKDNGGGEKKNKDSNSVTAVYKIDMQSEGCATKIKQYVKDFQVVEDVKAEIVLNKLTVVGKVDPTKLRDKLCQKTKKNVELVPKKDNKAAADDNKPDKRTEDKKPKEAPKSVLKLPLHCQGCIGKINRLVLKTKGCQEMTLDKEKELVVVKGTMDVKALAENLRNRLKRTVEIVLPKKEKDGGGSRGDGDKDGNGGGSGGGKKKGGGGDGGEEEGGGKNEVLGHPGFGYYENGYGYGSGFVNGYGHAVERKKKKGGDGSGGGKKKGGDGSGGGKKKGGGGDGGQEEGSGGGGGENRMYGSGNPGFGYFDHGYGYGNGFVNGNKHADGREWEWICARIWRTGGCTHGWTRGWALATCTKYVQW